MLQGVVDVEVFAFFKFCKVNMDEKLKFGPVPYSPTLFLLKVHFVYPIEIIKSANLQFYQYLVDMATT